MHQPEYPGGKKALNDFIKKNLRFPEAAIEKGIEGKVTVGFRILPDGSVSEARILAGLGEGCDEEALRLVHLLKYEPQNNRGRKVYANVKLAIPFKPPKKIKKTGQVKYNYQPSEKKENTYTYTVDIPGR